MLVHSVQVQQIPLHALYEATIFPAPLGNYNLRAKGTFEPKIPKMHSRTYFLRRGSTLVT